MSQGHKEPSVLGNRRFLRILVCMEKGCMWEVEGH